MLPKLILFDMDGTLLRNDKTISKYIIEILKKVAAKGIILGVCTGRPKRQLDTIFDEYQIKDVMRVYISLNGEVIIDKKHNYIKEDYKIEGSWLKEVLTRYDYDHLNGAFLTYDDKNCWFSKDIEEVYTPYIKYCDNIIIDKYLRGFWHKDTYKLIYRQYPMIDLETVELLKTFNDDRYHGYLTDKDTFDFVRKDINKAKGIKEICKLNNISLKDVWMFGDGENDIEPLMIVGKAIAMGNAQLKCKEIAAITCDTNENDGIARYLDMEIINES